MAYQPIQNPLPITGSITTTTDESQLDAFGRLRVSQLRTQLDLKHTFDDQPLYVNTVTSGTGAIARIAADSMMQMTTSAASDYAIAQTKQRFAYLSGKSFLTFETMSRFEAETNITKRNGYYSSSTSAPYTADFDGLYLESDGTDISVNVAKNGTITKTIQSSWNLDTMDGAGSSGITIDWSKAQIVVIDYEWLGVGRVRWGLVIDGAIIYFHQSLHANSVSSPYMQFSNQPLRWEIRQSGAGSGTFNYICSTVATEGDIGTIGKVLTANIDDDFINANSVGTRYAILGIRLKSTALPTLIDLIDLTTLAATADDWLWEIRINPTVAGTFTFNGITNSAVEYAKGAIGGSNTVTGGTVIASGYGAGGNNGGSIQSALQNALRIGSDIDGTVDELVLSVMPLTANLDIFGSLTWREFN